jgi:UDP-2-acetamido-2-deoxy-ribo-hexuluronate aminotransferase
MPHSAKSERSTAEMGLPFIDLKAQQRLIYPQLQARLERVLAHGQYILGPEVQELEARLAGYVGVKHAIACSSGTDALLLALMAYGVGPGDAVFVPTFTFVATAEVVHLRGATPVFVDVDSGTFNLDPQSLEEAILRVKGKGGGSFLTPKGIITVDLFGQPADYEAITLIARKHGLFVVEDAAQAFGATYRGARAGSLAEVAATSFFPAKPLGCYGDGGAIFTDDAALAETIRCLRVHGQGSQRYEHLRVGINGRLDTFQAAVLLTKLEIFDMEVEARQQVAGRYLQALAGVVELPVVLPQCTSVWAQFPVQSDARAKLQQKLKEAGIPTAIHYPRPLHLQPAFAHLGYQKGDFPVSERLSARIFSLPMHPYLSAADQERIVHALTR